MRTWHYVYLLAGCGAFGISFGVTPLFRRLAWRLHFVDKPLGEFHKQHAEATPLMGGMAMLVAWALTLAVGLAVLYFAPARLPAEVRDAVGGVTAVLPLLAIISAGAVALTVMGLVDDKRPLGPFVKLALQVVICGAVALSPSVRVTLFWQHGIVTWILTLGWFLFIINAFNFFDNMDGLASGVAVICAILFAVVAATRSQFFVATLDSVTAGCALGFYCHNRSPASIFMGDAGSHFLGYLLAVMGCLTVFYDPQVEPSVAAIVVPLLILALPIFDAFAVIVIRIRAGQPVYHGDHNHISHRFERMGMSRKTAVLLVHLLTVAIGLGALPLLWLRTTGAVLVLLQAAAMLALVSILHQAKSAEETTDDE